MYWKLTCKFIWFSKKENHAQNSKLTTNNHHSPPPFSTAQNISFIFSFFLSVFGNFSNIEALTMETKFLHNTHINHFLSLPSSSLSTPPFHFNLPNRNGNGEVQPQRGPRKAGCTQNLRLSVSVKGRLQVGPTHTQRRRALLLVGVSFLPFLTLRRDNAAFQVLASTSVNEHNSEKEDSKQEVTSLKGAPSNPVMSLLNSIGIIGSGVLAALYSIARKDKVRSDATIEFLISEVEEKDATIDSLKINFDAKMLHLQEKQYKLLSKVKEEKSSLLNRIESANVTVTALGRELRGSKRKIEEFQGQIENLEMMLGEARRNKQTLEDEMKEKDGSITILQENISKLSSEVLEKEITVNSLSSSLAQKDSDLENLNSAYKQTKSDLDAITSEIVKLKDELLKNQSELGQRNSVADDLSNRVDSLTNERDNLTSKLDALELLYNDFQISSEDKVARDAEILEEMEVELGQLRDKYVLAVTEAGAMQSVISDMNRDRDYLKKMLDEETEYLKTLKQDLESTEAALGSSINEISDLNRQLDESKRSCLELEGELSKVQAEFHHTSEFLQKSVKAALKTSAGLADELMSVKEEMDKTKNELQLVSTELATMTIDRNALQNELVEASSKIKAATMVYEEEKETVASLKKDLEALEEQASEDRVAKKSLETNVKEVTEFLDEMSKNFWALSRDLKVADSRVSSLLKEKDDLKNALEKEKQVAKEARDNLETAHNVVIRLGNDRESLEKRAKKLEEDLAFAKGEVLRLKVHSSKIVDGTIESVRVPSQEGERAVINKPEEEMESAIESKTEEEVEPAPAVVVNPKEETGSAINSEMEQEVELAPAAISRPKEGTESSINSDNEEGVEPAVISNPTEETNSAIKSETEQEVEPALVGNPKEETESATNGEIELEAEPAVISNSEGETKSDTSRQTEQEVELAVEKEAKRAVTTMSGTTLKRGGRKRKASNQ